jgi:hypothetical protein
LLRIIFRAFVGLLVAVALLYVGDWAVWRIRVASGGGMGSVVVSTMVVASLKGNKEEYYPQGTQTVACSKSIFPQVGGGACWWLQRHPEVDVRY